MPLKQPNCTTCGGDCGIDWEEIALIFDPKANDVNSWLSTIWMALHSYRETLIPEGDEMYDREWDEICTAMAWIEEDLKAQHPKSIRLLETSKFIVQQHNLNSTATREERSATISRLIVWSNEVAAFLANLDEVENG